MSNKTDLQRNNVILGDTPNGLIGGVSRIESALEKKNVHVEKAGTYATFSELETAINDKVTNTYDADATANDIASGKTAYAKGKKLTGNAQLVGKSDFSLVKARVSETIFFISPDNLLFNLRNPLNSSIYKDKDIYLFNDAIQDYEKVLDMSEYSSDYNALGYFNIYEDLRNNIFITLGKFGSNSSISSGTQLEIVKKFNRQTKHFDTVLTYTLPYNLSTGESFKPIFIEVNNKTFLSFEGGFYGFYCFNENTQLFERVDNLQLTSNNMRYNIIEYNNKYFGSYYAGLFEINIDTLEITELRTYDSGTNTYRNNKLNIFGEYLFNLDDYGVQVYDTNTQNFEVIYNNTLRPSYYFAGTGNIYMFNNNYIYYDKSQNLQGVLLLDPINKTYKQVIPLDESTSKYPAAQWSGFIERNGELFCYSQRQYSPNTWINKWNDTEKVFERVSDIIGYNYYVYVFENDIYIRCQNPTSDQTDKKFNIYKYNDTTKYFDTLVATTDSSTYFHMITVGTHTIMTTSNTKTYVRNSEGIFDTYFTLYGNISNHNLEARLIDDVNKIYVVYTPQAYNNDAILFDDINVKNLNASYPTLRGVMNFTEIVNHDDDLVLFINTQSDYNTYSIRGYRKSTKKYINDMLNPAVSSYSKFVYDKINDRVYGSSMFAYNWHPGTSWSKFDNTYGESVMGSSFKFKNTQLATSSQNTLNQLINGVDIPLCLRDPGYAMFNVKKFGKYTILYASLFRNTSTGTQYYQLIGTEDTSNES